MKDWRKAIINPTTSIVDTIKVIDTSALQIALVVDDANHLLGTVTDGDVRRGILRAVTLDQQVSEIMNENPVVANSEMNQDEMFNLMKEKRINQLPVVDEEGHIVNLQLLSNLIQPESVENWVVLMAGGFGTRLKPLTTDCPKPMVEVGGKPILETILSSITEQGFSKFFIAVNHMAGRIKDYFGDGSRWGVEIAYLEENKKLGTAGALSLLPEQPSKPILVMNGDLLTKVNYKQLINYHHEHNALATMCVREYSFQIPYGVVRIENNLIHEIDEKPVQRFFVNAGIYVLEPWSLEYIPHNECYDMTTLFEKIIEDNNNASVFPIREYWIDIGHHEDFEKANNDYGEVFTND